MTTSRRTLASTPSIRAPHAVWLERASKWAMWLALALLGLSIVFVIFLPGGGLIAVSLMPTIIAVLVLLSLIFGMLQWMLDGNASIADQLADKIDEDARAREIDAPQS